MSRTGTLTSLGYAILCEVAKEARSGYALRRVFETTPIGIFSGSQGTIYPALKRLTKEGLIRLTTTGKRPHFEITPTGTERLIAWLRQPVTSEDFSRRLELCLLRFAFMEGYCRPSLIRDFLCSFASVAERRKLELSAFLESAEGKTLPLHGRLAVEHGLRSTATTHQWAIDALAKLTDEREVES